jgi:hypothetical protein
MGSFNRTDSADSRHTEQQNRPSEQESPWMFRDLILESQYQNELIDSIYDRARPAANVFIGFSWLSKIHYFIILYFTEEKLEELIMARVILLAVFTVVFAMKLKAETRRRSGTPFIWIFRAILFPIHLFLETGIPVFYTELMAAQV